MVSRLWWSIQVQSLCLGLFFLLTSSRSVRGYRNIQRKKNQSPTTKLPLGTSSAFIKAIMAEMNKYDYMKGFYLIMANAPIHVDYPMCIFLLIRIISIRSSSFLIYSEEQMQMHPTIWPRCAYVNDRQKLVIVCT